VLVSTDEAGVLEPVPGVTVTFAGQHAVTGSGGATSLTVRLPRAGRYRLVASRAGCNQAVAVVRVATVKRVSRHRR
jgi:hypothetical protein